MSRNHEKKFVLLRKLSIKKSWQRDEISLLSAEELVLYHHLLTEKLVEEMGKQVHLTAEGRDRLKRALCESETFCADQHRENVVVETPNHMRVVNLAESPLSRLYNRRGRGGKRLIAERQYDAGERLRRDFEMGQMGPKLGLSLTPRVDGGAHHQERAIGQSAMDARTRVNKALTHVGREMGGVLLDICCYLKGLEMVERERQWPARSAKIILAMALDRLADHYGLAEMAVGRERKGNNHLKIWHAPS